jgi:repressor LexA
MDYLGKLKKFYKNHKRLPSYSEMLSLFSFASKNAVFKVIQRLISEGFLKKEDGKIAPTSKFFALPLLGLIKAGFPILADENRQYMSLDEYLIEEPTSSFLLKVSGDSLIGIGIFDGDIVIIEKTKEANPGDIVLAQIDGEWTLKILNQDYNTRIAYLSSANPNYPPFYPRHDLQLFGRVKGVIRKF